MYTYARGMLEAMHFIDKFWCSDHVKNLSPEICIDETWMCFLLHFHVKSLLPMLSWFFITCSLYVHKNGLASFGIAVQGAKRSCWLNEFWIISSCDLQLKQCLSMVVLHSKLLLSSLFGYDFHVFSFFFLTLYSYSLSTKIPKLVLKYRNWFKKTSRVYAKYM